jgi:putative flippase GtrA
MNLLNKKFIKYVFFAIITSGLNVLTYFICYEFILNSVILSNIVAYVVSIVVSFSINKKIVFKDKNKTNLNQFICYLLVKLISFSLDSVVLLVAVDYLNINHFLSKLIANASTTISNYTLNNRIVFKSKKERVKDLEPFCEVFVE